MALPQPTYPPVVPQSFITGRDERLLSRGLELYARYHPAAMQQQVYQTLLEEETWQAAKEDEKMQRLVKERERLYDLRTQAQAARATGGRVSGGGGGRTKGGATSGWTGASKSMVDLYLGEGKLTQAAKDDVYRDYSVPKGGDYVVSQIINRLNTLGQKQGLTNETLDQVIGDVVDETLKARNSPMWEWRANTPQVKALASELWMKLSEHPQFNQMEGFTIGPGGRRAEGGVAAAIDKYFDTGGWLSTVRAAGAVPGYELQAEMNAALAGKTPSGFKYDLDGDGTISEEERKAAAARDPDRLFEDRIRQLDAQIAARGERSSPMARAARRTLGRDVEDVEDVEDDLPSISPDALSKAAELGGPLAAESLPYAMRRVKRGNGIIEPKTKAEETAQQLINAGVTSFPLFAEEVLKAGLTPEERLEAQAYYGAYYYDHELKRRTLNQGAIAGDARRSVADGETAAPTPEQSLVEDVERPRQGRGDSLAPEVGADTLIPGINTALGPGEQLGWRAAGSRGPGSGISPETNAPLYMTDPPYAVASAPAPEPEPGLLERARAWQVPDLDPYVPRAWTGFRGDWMPGWKPGDQPFDEVARSKEQAEASAGRVGAYARDALLQLAGEAGWTPPVMDPYVEAARARQQAHPYVEAARARLPPEPRRGLMHPDLARRRYERDAEAQALQAEIDLMNLRLAELAEEGRVTGPMGAARAASVGLGGPRTVYQALDYGSGLPWWTGEEDFSLYTDRDAFLDDEGR